MNSKNLNFHFLYFDGCPSWKTGLKNLQDALTQAGIQAEIQMVKIDTEQKATDYRFLGSPSFVLNNNDLWPEERDAYHLGCRIYATPQGMKGSPTVEMLQDKIQSSIRNI